MDNNTFAKSKKFIKLKRAVSSILAGVVLFSAGYVVAMVTGTVQRARLAVEAAGLARDINYKREMARLVIGIHAYGRAVNPAFELIGNNASGMFAESSSYDHNNVVALAESMEGVLLESFFYGWGNELNRDTPEAERTRVKKELEYARRLKTPILNIDYCNAAKKIVSAAGLNKRENFVSFTAETISLNRIPLYPVKLEGENEHDITKLSQIKNFLCLLNPEAFPNKDAYINSLRDTNYDLLIIDFSYNGLQLTKQDVERLKVKKNGGKRLVFSYLSIGEAEDYRHYWKKEWSKQLPEWVEKESTDWKGNYKVAYWTPVWKDILYGNPEAYLDRILDADFDGAFLDIVDAWVHFEELRRNNK